MMGIQHTIRVALVLSSLFVGSRLWADDGEREVAAEINKANGLLRSGDIDAAVKAYGQMQTGAPARPNVSYNMAVAQYRKGDMASAEQLFKQTSTAENDALAAKSRYNLGNCNYAAALRQAKADRSAAIKGLSNAIDNYRSALDIDPNDADSRANIELAAAMIEKLREQEKKQQQQQDKKQQNQKQQSQQNDDKQNEQNKENSKPSDSQQQKDSQQRKSKDHQQSQQKEQQQKPESSQENKSKGEKGTQDQKKKSGDDKNQASDKNESHSKDQKSQSQESKSEQQESKLQAPESKSQSQEQNKPPSATEKQQPQSQSATQKKPTNKSPHEQDAAQPSEQPKDKKGSAAPKGSLTAADQKAGKTDKQDKDLVEKPDIAPDGAMTTQEAEKMLQAIRDQEMIRRLRRQAAERNQHVPVDRDW